MRFSSEDRNKVAGATVGREFLSATNRGSLALYLFFLAILLPIYIDIGTLRFTPIRIYLLATMIPATFLLVSGAFGRISLPDVLCLLYSIWIAVTITYHEGAEKIPYGAVLGIEVFGGYLLGRALVTDDGRYRSFIRCYIVILLMIFPLALYELLYFDMPLREWLKPFFTVIGKNYEFRMGMSRVQVAFPHSILYGLFCSISLGSVFYLYTGFWARTWRISLIVGMTLMSLSSAPMIAVALQGIIILWGLLTKERWKFLLLIFVIVYVFLSILSNRGPVVLFIETFTLDPMTGWWRVHIWRYGTDSVWANPIMGLGLGDWVRPSWLSGSVDNFWLLMAMRHGLPGILLLGSTFLVHIALILRQKNLSVAETVVRKGYLVTLIGLVFTLATVHVWDAISVMVFFFLGAGAFLYASDRAHLDQDPIDLSLEDGAHRTKLPFTRYSEKLDGRKSTLSTRRDISGAARPYRRDA